MRSRPTARSIWLATAAGDKQTAKLARDILRQEVRMQEFLAGLPPKPSVDVAHDEIPVPETTGRRPV